jgi:hypothetical protein
VVHGLKLLDSYRGIVQCDGYAAYKTIADKAPGKAITLAFVTIYVLSPAAGSCRRPRPL